MNKIIIKIKNTLLQLCINISLIELLMVLLMFTLIYCVSLMYYYINQPLK